MMVYVVPFGVPIVLKDRVCAVKTGNPVRSSSTHHGLMI